MCPASGLSWAGGCRDEADCLLDMPSYAMLPGLHELTEQQALSSASSTVSYALGDLWQDGKVLSHDNTHWLLDEEVSSPTHMDWLLHMGITLA